MKPLSREKVLETLCWGVLEASGDVSPEDGAVPADEPTDYELLWEHVVAIRRILKHDYEPGLAISEMLHERRIRDAETP